MNEWTEQYYFALPETVYNKNQTKLTDSQLEDTLRISCSPRVLNLKKLAKENKCNFSY